MKKINVEIAIIGLASVSYGLLMSVRALPVFFRTLDAFSSMIDRAGVLAAVIFLLHILVYICFIAAGAAFLMVRRWGIGFLRAAISAGLVLNLFGILNYWYHAVFADKAPLAMEGKVVARSSIVPVYIIFIFQIVALYFINRPSLTEKFEEKR